jgi:hypothetical protein
LATNKHSALHAYVEVLGDPALGPVDLRLTRVTADYSKDDFAVSSVTGKQYWPTGLKFSEVSRDISLFGENVEYNPSRALTTDWRKNPIIRV